MVGVQLHHRHQQISHCFADARVAIQPHVLLPFLLTILDKIHSLPWMVFTDNSHPVYYMILPFHLSLSSTTTPPSTVQSTVSPSKACQEPWKQNNPSVNSSKWVLACPRIFCSCLSGPKGGGTRPMVRVVCIGVAWIYRRLSTMLEISLLQGGLLDRICVYKLGDRPFAFAKPQPGTPIFRVL
ncbi:hypothetical protein IAQ61_005846 [Plenodomus lingam]|uniref:uncharacterized protein n=1 Tax=Leptosphaeria maculans TaxID=5022 RepID=UPI00332BB881|nr:hypothetical protein IAQ61_005846 [Plenodomus lingam]